MSVAKRVPVEKLPKCQIGDCDNDAHYDAQTATGSWGYLCQKHYHTHAVASQMHSYLYVIQKKKVKHLEGIPVVMLEYELDGWGDADATVTCPACGHIHNIETDMNGEMKCHSCKQPFRCKSIF